MTRSPEPTDEKPRDRYHRWQTFAGKFGAFQICRLCGQRRERNILNGRPLYPVVSCVDARRP